ncbi:MAG: TatD family hydrolase [Candidatus Shapirobacteria bacterium]|nr:TatD family hydrolase [Candidatus Shapirobacteria bacterium]MDD5074040.1 TatD family hydrolase [Candidatus Shapirobacteria bacterium]MDD5481595.1 TatD family hydrolase [Candidatus Shapirobacteria bacterium]
MLFDTHCHLNFDAFADQEEKVITQAQKNNVGYFLVPGANLESSQKATLLAKKYPNVWAAIGIHPHHAQDGVDFKKLENLIKNPQVTAIGEIGLDYHQYRKTKHKNYQIDNQFKKDQKNLFVKQLKLAQKYQKPIIFHNREAKADMLAIIEKNWHKGFENHAVFHCCEPDEELLTFAQKHQIFIGVDGDVTYWNKKARFIKEVPLERLVLETDSPYLTPEPTKKEQPFPNEPQNLKIIAEFVAKTKNLPLATIAKQTTVNAKQLFSPYTFQFTP